ncbi:MAG: hypothetical protein FIO03_08055 [Nitrosopumilales archaeon]|nr:hypothetical protein [Nitrosopumilales archaeon]
MSSIAQATCPNTLRIGEMQIMLVVNCDSEKINVRDIDIIFITSYLPILRFGIVDFQD